MQYVAIILLVPLVLFGIYWILWRAKNREERRVQEGPLYLRTARAAVWTLGILGVPFFVGAIAWAVWAICDPQDMGIGLFAVGECLALALFALCLFGIWYAKLNYAVVDEEEIVTYRWGKPGRRIALADICYYQASAVSLLCFDADGLVLLSVDFMTTGGSRLGELLAARGAQAVTLPFPTEQMRKSERYRMHQRLSLYALAAVVIGLGALPFSVFLLVQFFLNGGITAVGGYVMGGLALLCVLAIVLLCVKRAKLKKQMEQMKKK